MRLLKRYFSMSKYKALFLVWCLSSGAVIAADTDTIRLTSGEWPPYLSEHLPSYGFASHVVSEAFAAMGVQVEYSFFPWGRALYNAGKISNRDDERWHGSIVWLKTAPREKRFVYSDRVVLEPQAIFFLKGTDTDLPAEEYLSGRRVGVTYHAEHPVLDEMERKGLITLERIGNYEMLFKRLLLGRVDAVVVEQQVGRFYLNSSLKKTERERITRLKSHLGDRDFHLILNRHWGNAERYIEIFNQGLKALKDDGRYAQYMDQLNEGYYDRVNRQSP